jgi:hypothetical protein
VNEGKDEGQKVKMELVPSGLWQLLATSEHITGLVKADC